MRTVDEWTDRYAELLVEEGWGGAGEAYVREADRRALRRLAVEMRDEIVSALARALAEKGPHWRRQRRAGADRPLRCARSRGLH